MPAPAVADDTLFAFFWAAALASVVLPHLPFGRQALYPFGLLSTWVHEMGHGVFAVLIGGRFKRLEIYPNLGGVAFSSGVWGAGRAVVSAGGLLGPSLAGAAVVVLGSRQDTAPWVLSGVAALVALSLVLVVRNLFGWLSLGAVAAALGLVAYYAPEEVRVFLAQLIGIQFCLASFSSVDYLFTKQFRRDGRVIDSDTQEIAKVLVLPYWFWGGLIALVSFAVLAAAFYLAWLRPALNT